LYRTFTRLLSFTTSNNTEIITNLTNSTEQTTTIPEIFYSNYARPLIIIAIEQHCSLDCIVELTIQILNTFDSSEVIVERVLADLIQVGKKPHENFIGLFEF
jgi:phosphopentomutase